MMQTQIISGNSIANICDHIFSQTIVDESTSTGYRIVKNTDVIMKIKSGQSIFVKTDYLFDFFSMIKSREDIKCLNLVTHDSDRIIDLNIANNIPTCINKMFSINACVIDKKIIPIPIGIANSYCKITLKPQEQKQFSTRGTKALVACNVTNNPIERERLYHHRFDDGVTVVKGSVSLSSYESLLDQHDFIFCPEGNGPDTHRIWESLYKGKIPIVKTAAWNRNFRDLPIMFVDSLLDASENNRALFLSNFDISKFQTQKLSLNYWSHELRKVDSIES